VTASVLLVDDDPALLRALPEALRLRMGDLQVTTVSSAADALELAGRIEYDAIVTDIKMARMDGFELLEQLRRLRPTTPTLLITGHGERDLAVKALRGGAYDFVQKPIDRDYIVASLRRAIKTSRLARRLEEQRRALARDARVLNEMSEGVFVLAADGRVELWNEAAALITGVPAAEALGRPIDSVLPGWAEVSPVIDVAEGHAPGSPPARIVPLDTGGTELWLSFNAVRFEDTVIYTFRNASVERPLDQLKRDFLATVSHELRTPLAAVYGVAKTLWEHDPADTAMRRQLLGVLLDEAGRLTRLVEDLLTASALETNRLALTVEPLEPVALVRSVVDAIRAASPEGNRIELELPDEAPPLLNDPGKLRQVLTNLIDNAVKYTPASGDITVGIEPRETSLRFFVRDSGPGIPPDEERRIFEKFYRADPEQNEGVGGSGLGLYISHELVRRMNGRIMVTSRPNRGSTFFVDLPLELPSARRPTLSASVS
jgi:signal transduction histidine kinase